MFTKKYDRLDVDDVESTQRLTSKDHPSEETLYEFPFRSWERPKSYKTIVGYTLVATIWSLLFFTAGVLTNRAFSHCGFERGFPTDLDPLKSMLATETVRFQGQLYFADNGTLLEKGHDGIQYTGDPSDELDNAWKKLLQVDAVDLIESEADTVRGKTILKESGHSVVGVSVFHQLHCLNMIRQAAWPDLYKTGESERGYRMHLNHCVDYLRQIIMCNVDITPMTASWSTVANRPVSNFETLHTCRNFDKVKEWVVARSGHKHPLPYAKNKPKPVFKWPDLHIGADGKPINTHSGSTHSGSNQPATEA
ncbi:hypothetical protein VHEMI03067 [[Torrubiella] hemipterigena]|uniref:Tat pathway signal sequence n=1 Tax=[Torrubiella] hemipterigena TaxID=1531966 RepID=A0A0A1TA06_9HYPO|nr:hypothetical protein VHEMI03067 [[Torrubiella] hemipterigena]